MEAKELIESIELLCKCVSDKSSEEQKTVIIEDMKPSSFSWIMECLYEYIEMHEGGLK